MQKIDIILVGQTKELWLREAIEEYMKRLKVYVSMKFTVIPDESRISSKANHQILEKEAERIRKALPKGYCKVVLDLNGKEYSSEEFAGFIEDKKDRGQNIVFIAGGASGLSERILQEADSRISFSKLTFTHQMIRVLLLEQIYRGFTIIAGTGYHK